MKQPWFCIIECDRRSMTEIVSEIAGRYHVRVADIIGHRRTPVLGMARQEAYDVIRVERPDLTSGQVARFLNRESSTIRHAWRKQQAA